MSTKISALTSATTPLAGTETLPIVQSSATTKVTVANLTAGRAISAATITSTGVTSALVFTGNNNGTYPTQQAGGTISFNGSGGFSEVNFWNTNSSTPYYSFTWLQQTGASSKTTLMTLNTTELTVPGNIKPTTSGNGINFTANTPASGMTSQLLNWYEEGTWTPADASGAGLTFTSVTAKYTRIGRQVTATAVLTFPTTASAIQSQISGLPFAASNMGMFLQLRTGVAGAGQGLVGAGGTTIVMYNQAGNILFNSTQSTATIYLTGTYFV